MNNSLFVKVEELTPDKLLAIATRFDAGPLPIVNGRPLNPYGVDADQYHISIEFRGKGWAIVSPSGSVLAKDGHWEVERQPSSRIEADYQRTRYASALDAMAAYFVWRDTEMAMYSPLEFEGKDA